MDGPELTGRRVALHFEDPKASKQCLKYLKDQVLEPVEKDLFLRALRVDINWNKQKIGLD